MANETVERKCENCEHAIFNRLWGEYKCGVNKRYIRHTGVEAQICNKFEPRKSAEVKISKEGREKYGS